MSMHKERQARAGIKSGRTYEESNCHESQEFFESNCILGYHDVYREVWEAGFGEVLVCKREPESASNWYTVAKKRNKLL